MLTVSIKSNPAYLYVNDKGVTFDEDYIVVYNNKGEIAYTIPANKLNVKIDQRYCC